MSSSKQFTPLPESTEYFEDKRYILYVNEKQQASQLAKEIAAPLLHYQVRVINVEDLEERPWWLRGTPTLVDVNTKMAHGGSNVIDELRNLVEADDGMGPRIACQPPSWLQGLQRLSPDLEGEEDMSKYQEKSSSRGITDKDIERYQKRRASANKVSSTRANKPMAHLSSVSDKDYSDGNMDPRLSDGEIEEYLRRRDHSVSQRRGPPSARSTIAVSDTMRRTVTDDRLQRYMQRREQPPHQRQKPPTKRRRL